MKKLSLSLALSVLTLTLSATVCLAKDYRKSLNLSEQAVVGQQRLEKGTYTVRFSDTPGEVVFYRGDREVARASYEVSTLTRSAPYNAVTFTNNENGSKKLNRLEFQGLSFALTLR